MTSTCSSRHIISSLVSSLARAQASSLDTTSNPLSAATQPQKDILLTIYAAFPSELPAALNLLDRHLVYRFHTVDHKDVSQHQEAEHQPKRARLDSRDSDRLQHTHAPLESSEARSTGFPAHEHEAPPGDRHGQAASPEWDRRGPVLEDKPKTGLYYVRSAQQHMSRRSRWRDENPAHYEVRLTSWSCSCPAFIFSALPTLTPQRSGTLGADTFGGVSLGDDMSICKHLLACYLAEHCKHFEAFVEERHVSIAEMAGWAAGWGD